MFDVVFARINETLSTLSDVNLELLCDCMFATNTKSFIHVSKENVKWLSYLGVEYYSYRESNFWEKIN